MSRPSHHIPFYNGRRQSGFAFVEIATILIVIGLLTGVWFVGNALILQSEVRRVITDIGMFNMAVTDFVAKYNVLPGDMPNATDYWGTDENCPNTPARTEPKMATCNGNGDNKIGTMDGYGYEALRFWQHLADAKMIPGKYTGTGAPATLSLLVAEPGVNTPRGPVPGTGYAGIGWYVSSVSSPAYFNSSPYQFVIYYGALAKKDAVPDNPALLPAQAQAVDRKVDDGLPGMGLLQTLNPTQEPDCATSADPQTALYQTSSRDQGCALLFLMKF